MTPAFLTPSEALKRLREGNRRYRSGRARHPRQDEARRRSLHEEQTPFATLLSCADSRVPPQLIFDQGLGDLFTNRVAGNLADEIIIASIAYSVEQLGVPLVVVLGHTGCGAVRAAAEKLERREVCDDALTHAICPVIHLAKDLEGDLLNNAVNLNVVQTVKQLSARPEFASHLHLRNLEILEAVYNLTTGKVEFLSPNEAAIAKKE